MPKLMKRPNSPFWYARFMMNGKDLWISTKKKKLQDAKLVAEAEERKRRGTGTLDEYFKGLLDAMDKLPTNDQDQKRQEYAKRLLRGQASVLRLSDTWQTWRESPIKGNPSRRTVSGYEAIWKRFARWVPRHNIDYLHEVTPLLAQDYSGDLWKSNVSPATFNAHVKFLRSMFHVLADKAGLAANPWQRIKTLDKETQGRENFTPDELTIICARAPGAFRYMIGIGVYTGMRLGDVVNLRWENVGRDNIDIIPLKTRRKGKKVTMPIHPVLGKLLSELRATSRGDYLFPEERELYLKDTAAVTSRFQQFLEGCGIKTTEKMEEHRRRAIVRKGFHSLRHSFVSLCAANRVPQVAIQELVGHGSPAMTALYSHADLDQKKNAIGSLPAISFKKKGKREAR